MRCLWLNMRGHLHACIGVRRVCGRNFPDFETT
jgi:hypothetical protein